MRPILAFWDSQSVKCLWTLLENAKKYSVIYFVDARQGAADNGAFNELENQKKDAYHHLPERQW